MTPVSQPVLKEIESLSASPDPQVRVYGLIRMESHLDELDFADVERILSRAMREGDRILVEQARRIQALLRSRGVTRQGADARLPVFRIVDAAVLGKFPAVKGHDPEKLRGAAYDLVTPLALRLHTQALQGSSPLIDKVIECLARLQLPQSLPVLAHLSRDAFLAERIVPALAAYRTAEAEEVLLSMAGDPSNPMTMRATEELGRGESPGSAAFLERALRDPDTRRRRAAALALGASRDPRAGEWLLATLADGNEDVTVAGIQSLARLRVTRAADNLINLSKGSEVTRIRATVASALARVQSPAACDYLQMLLGDPDPRVKANAIESLSFYAITKDQALKFFVPGLRSDIPRVRGNSVLGLYKHRPPQAVESIAEMLKAPDRMMRRAGAFCAGQIQTAETAQRLITMVLTEQTPEVLKTGMSALEKFGRRESVDVILRMAGHPRVEVRLLAMQILSEIGGPQQMAPLSMQYKRDDTPRVRASIASTLTRIGGENALTTLRVYLQDPDDRVVANVVQGLHDVNNIEALSFLKPLLSHRNRRVRANTIVNLFALGELKVIAELSRMMESKDPKDQTSGLWALGAIGEDLRLGSLEERNLLCMALTDYHRKVLDSSSASGARLLASVMHLRHAAEPAPKAPGASGSAEVPTAGIAPMPPASGPSPPPPPPPPAADAGSERRPKAACGLFGPASGPPKGAVPDAPASPSGAAGAPIDPASVVRQLVDGAGEGPVAASPEPAPLSPPAAVDAQEKLLIWEKFLDLTTRDVTLACEALAHHTRENPDDEVALLIYLRALRDQGPGQIERVLRQSVPRRRSYIALLYELARSLKEIGEVGLSFEAYLQVFRSQYQALDRIAGIAQETSREERPQLPVNVLKQLSSFSGLAPDLDLELGNLYLGEMMLPEALHHLYRVRAANPQDSNVALKLAYICRKQSHFRLGRVLCKSMLSQLAEDHPDHQRAVRILHDIKNKEDRAREAQSPGTAPEAPEPDRDAVAPPAGGAEDDEE
jgi:HEAT repeat protein